MIDIATQVEVCAPPGDGDIAAAVAFAVQHFAPEASGGR